MTCVTIALFALCTFIVLDLLIFFKTHTNIDKTRFLKSIQEK